MQTGVSAQFQTAATVKTSIGAGTVTGAFARAGNTTPVCATDGTTCTATGSVNGIEVALTMQTDASTYSVTYSVFATNTGTLPISMSFTANTSSTDSLATQMTVSVNGNTPIPLSGLTTAQPVASDVAPGKSASFTLAFSATGIVQTSAVQKADPLLLLGVAEVPTANNPPA